MTKGARVRVCVRVRACVCACACACVCVCVCICKCIHQACIHACTHASVSSYAYRSITHLGSDIDNVSNSEGDYSNDIRRQTGECLNGPVSTPEDRVLKRPLGRSLHLFASTAHSLCSLHGSILGLAFLFPSWDWKFHDSRYTGMIAIVKPVGCDLLCMVEFFLYGRDH